MSIRTVRASRAPIAPSAPHLDVDAIVGIACVLMLPIALWLA